MSLRVYIAGLVMAVATIPVHASTIAYAEALGSYNGKSQSALWRIDLDARTASVVGPSTGTAGLVNGLAPFNMRGLTFNPQGALYAVSEDLEVLVQINRGNGTATLVGPLNLTGPGVATAQNLDLSMAFTCDGRAWLASAGTGNLWQVNTASGATTLVGSTGGTLTGLAAKGNALYATGSRSDTNLYSVDLATAKLTAIGAYGGGNGAVRTISPAFDASGTLWATLNNVGPNSPGEQWSNLAQIASTGAMTKLGTITGPTSLEGVGLVGLAITAPTCTTTGAADPLVRDAPVLAPRMLVALAALLGLVATFALRRAPARAARRTRS